MHRSLSFRSLIILSTLPLLVVIGFVLNFDKTNESNSKPNVFGYTNNIISDTLPFANQLRQSGVDLRYSTGETLQDGIFVSNKGLIKNIPDVSEDFHHLNTKAILDFNKNFSSDELTIYAMIIPSASGVLKDNLPDFSTTINQRTYIENTYNQFAGEISQINVFNTLFENKDKYIYYRTEDSITPMGGYYIYSEMIRRMLVAGDVSPINEYGVSYSTEEFYGTLYKDKPYKNVASDILSYYYNENVKYNVNHIHKNGTGNYNSFYDKNLPGLSSYRYDLDGIIEIKSDSNAKLDLLIIGDNSAVFVLPFIYHHYDKVTYVNMNNLGSLSPYIDTHRYDQIVIAADFDTYMNSDSLVKVLESLSD